MKRLITIFVVSLVVFAGSISSQEKKQDGPSRIEVSADTQQAFSMSQAKVALAEAQLKTARLEQENLLLRAVITNKVPEEYYPAVGEDGHLYFQKPTPPKPEARATGSPSERMGADSK